MSHPAEDTEYGRCEATAKSTGEQCGRAAIGEHGKCDMHGGKSTGPPKGSQNAKTHGAFSEHFRSDLTEAEEEALQAIIDGLEDVEGARAIPAEVAAEALMKYKRSADSRFLREARQWMAEFNLLPNEDVFEHTGDGGGPLSITFSEEIVETEWSDE